MTDEHGPHPDPPPIPGALLDMIESVRYEMAQVLDGLIDEVENARAMPLSNSVIVGRADFLSRLEEARARLTGGLGTVIDELPEELRAARWMVRERESYVARTNEKAREVIAKAQHRSEELVADSYIVEEAVNEANMLVRNAENEARRIRLEAEDEAESRLADAEAALTDLLGDLQEARSRLHGARPRGPGAPGAG